MKKKERVIVLILIAILIVVIVIGAVRKNTTEKGTTQEGRGASQQQSINKAAKEGSDGASEGSTKKVSGINTSPKVNEERKFEGFRFSNIQLNEDASGMVSLLADVTNEKSSDTTDFTKVDIIFYDENEQEIGSVLGLIKPLKASETTQLNASFTYNNENATAYDFKIVEHKD